MSKDFSLAGKTYHIQPATDGCEGCAAVSDHVLCAAFNKCYEPDTILVEVADTKWPAPTYGPDAKPTNPKQAMGDSKVPLHLVPASALHYEALAYAEGALKYGAANWRVAGVRTSTYIAACLRHLTKYWNGEDHDPKSKVHHLGNARACLGIILDATVSGMITDDRPPKQELTELVAELEGVLAHLKELHKDCNPKHYTELNKDAP